jgi:hypothetical protein
VKRRALEALNQREVRRIEKMPSRDFGRWNIESLAYSYMQCDN